jgi:uncharacterized repeat protein (TIGR01451 family)
MGDLPTGPLQVQVLQSIPIWQICDNPSSLTVPPAPSQTQHDFAAQPTTDCPLMQIDLATNLLRPCSTSVWHVTYCNIGGGTAQNASVQLVGGGPLTLVNCVLPYTIQGDTMTVNLGDVSAGQCGQFSFNVHVACDNTIAGNEYCVEAHIFPDTFCLPAGGIWGGAMIESKGVCTGDSVQFTIKNVGSAATSTQLGYVIIDDMVIMRMGAVPAGLQPGTAIHETVPANGTSFRIKVAQEPGHPLAQSPSVAVENCNGQTYTSLLDQFSNEDREVVSSFDPNEKLAFPRGYGAAHFIDANTRIDYQLNFQNTGTDTAFTVVLRDTLSPLLDITSIRMGAGSHPFTWNLKGSKVLEVRFDHILLPDSSASEPQSHGFVQFNIGQQKDNPNGSVISNRAGIYFDINPAVLTNTVWHTVGKDYILLATGEAANAPLLRVSPNPATDQTYLTLNSDHTVQIRLVDQMGRIAHQYSGKAPGVVLQRGNLPAGLYFIETSTWAGWSKVGKLIWE